MSLLVSFGAETGPGMAVDQLTFNGQVDPEAASFVLKGRLKGGGGETNEAKLIYSQHSEARLVIEGRTNRQTFTLQTRIHQGQLKELVLTLKGQGNIQQVAGEQVRDWSLRHGSNGIRFLVIRPLDPEKTTNTFNATVSATSESPALPTLISPLLLSAEQAAWQEGSLRIESPAELEVTMTNAAGLTLLPATGPATLDRGTNEPKALVFQFVRTSPELQLYARETDPDARRVFLDVFQLDGEVHEQAVSFILKGTAHVKHPEGGRLAVLRGDAALTADPEGIEMIQTNGAYVLVLPRAGSYPVRLQFDAKLSVQNGWKKLSFATAPGAMRPVFLKNLAPETQVRAGGAAKPERAGADFVTYPPPDGDLALEWKETKTESEGKLFFAVQGVIQMAVGPGLLRQAHFMEYKVLQGDLTRLVFQVRGEGEVTRVSGANILSWKMEPGTNPTDRRLVIELNQAQKDRYAVTIQTQSPLTVFPAKTTPLRLTPSDAIRYGGHLMVVNDGAVRLEVTETRGLSQISREQFPQIKELAALAPTQRSQGFAYRFSGPDVSLAILADNILPELSVSEVVQCHLSETEVRLDAELELDIREAPLREFLLHVPADFAVSRVNAEHLSDFFVTPGTNAAVANLRLVFSQPLTNRQIVQLRLEKNQNFTGTNWSLPAIRPQLAKTVRGSVAATADLGLRLQAGQSEGLTEIAGALFPRKIPGIQLAYRIRDNSWQATLGVERLARSVQVEAFHLFSISEGAAYGSSVMKYTIGGTPIASLRVEAPAEYGNVEFVGRDVRSWKKTPSGYEVFLQAPVFGAYTLLATFDRKLNATGEVVSFIGPRPLEVQSEQGSVVVVSELQFEVRNVAASTNATRLEPAEIPLQERLLFDAPILAAYHYLGRPFTLNLTLTSLAQGETVHQVVDRAVLETRVSHAGEVVTRASYFVKSQGYPHWRLTLPASLKLWEASVNGTPAVPITDAQATLIPLPARNAAEALLRVDLVLAGRSAGASVIRLEAPAIANPVLLTEWKVEPEAGFEIRYRQGDLALVGTVPDRSGFAWLRLLANGVFGAETTRWAVASLASLFLGALAFAWATRDGRFRFGFANITGLLVGVAATAGALYGLVWVANFASNHPFAAVGGGITTQAPIVDAGKSLQMELRTVPANSYRGVVGASVAPGLGLLLWALLALRGSSPARSRPGLALGWSLAGWAVLVWPSSAPLFIGLLVLFGVIHMMIPAWQRQRALPAKPRPAASAAPVAGMAGLLLLAGVLAGGEARGETGETNVVRSLVQTARVKEGYVQVQARMQWQAAAGQTLVFLRPPSVLTSWKSAPATVNLREQLGDNPTSYELAAREAGRYTVEFDYQIPLGAAATTNGFKLPTPTALVNTLNLEFARGDVEVLAPDAVSLTTTHPAADTTRASLVLAPASQELISWQPRSRDVRAEKALFYAELAQLFIPAPGAIESICDVQVRPAQGQLTEMRFLTPPGFTTTDVQAGFVSGWRFDPDTRALTVQFHSPQSRPFTLRLRLQLSAGALPYRQSLSLIQVTGAAGQVGQAGIATGPEVQLDAVVESGLSAINLEDFPTNLVSDMAAQVAGLTVRRAFRSTAAEGTIQMTVSAVEPEIRVQSQDTLSLGEDRVVLASQLQVAITRAGIFKLSFALPPEMEIESISGAALSHWTEFGVAGQRVVTLHLNARTEGDCAFNITLGGPGMQQRKEFEAPRLLLREATKHSGQLVIVPETGLRLHAKTREGAAQLDPQKSGIPQKGVLAFHILQANWRLGFDVETVEPWIELALLQDVTVQEGLAKVAVQFQYQIENAGVKSLQALLPAAAENPRFTADFMNDAVRLDTNQTGAARWEIKLQRRVIGPYAMKLTYQIPIAATRLTVAGVEGQAVNLQRGYLALHSTGRLQLKMPALPSALEPAEWQAIPNALRRGPNTEEAKDTFRIREPRFALNLDVARHELAPLLPARIEKTELSSVLSPEGVLLTEVRLTLQPGDKRLLHLKLPPGGHFWQARVNQESAWPWRSGEEIRLPIAPNTDTGQPSTVEFLYQCPARPDSGTPRRFRLSGPQFDLPLENISWRVYVSDQWKVSDWKSTLQLVTDIPDVVPAAVSVPSYLEAEAKDRQEKTRNAENYLQMGNQLLQKGSPQEARRAFASAWRLSAHDAAFNEDARVQLHNLKLQQALLGLNRRPGSPDADRQPTPPRAESQAQAQQGLDQNTSEENQALMRLAERLIRQQDAATAQPESIRATLPQEGQLLTFTGALQVETWKDLRIQLDVKSKSPEMGKSHAAILLAIFAGLTVLVFASRRRTPGGQEVPNPAA